MLADLTSDKKFLLVTSTNKLEINQLRISLTREVPNAWLIRKMNKYIDTKRCFLNQYGLIPIGLWLFLIKICKQYNLELKISDTLKEYLSSFKLDHDEFFNYVNLLFKDAKNLNNEDFKPYDYQIEAAYNLLKYKKCCTEISTSGGKTLISFIIFKYLIDHNEKNILYIVPSVDLAVQSAEKYEEYQSYLKNSEHNWEIGILKSGLKKEEKEKVESCNILFGTFQSLCKKNFDFFNRFTVHIGDECHHYQESKSLKNILDKCHNLKYSFGVTGTFPKEDKYGYLTLQSYIGPLVYILSANDLINKENRGTPIYIVFDLLSYASDFDKEMLFNMRDNKDPDDLTAGAKCLREELKYVNKQYKRIKYIGDLAIKTKNNTILLFGDVKGGYGKTLYEYIKENSNKDVYYADGGTLSKNRDYFKSQMENDLSGNTIIVASIGTFGEGIDIKNLWNIFLINSAKSERIVRQICGRGLRQFEGKDKVILFDFVDDLRFSTKGNYRKENYIWKHYIERKKIYDEQNFPIFKIKTDL